MKKKAQSSILFSLIVAFMLFVSGIIIMNYIKDDVSLARGSSQMDCTNSSISDGAKLTCIGIDIVVPYFIIAVISVAGGVLTARLLV